MKGLATPTLLLAALSLGWQLPDGAPVRVEQWRLTPHRGAALAGGPLAALPILRARLHAAGVAGHLVHAVDETLWLIAEPGPALAETLADVRREGSLGLYRVVEDPLWLDAAIAARPLPAGVTREGNQLIGPDPAVIHQWVGGRISPDFRLLFERRDDRYATVLGGSDGLDRVQPTAARARDDAYGFPVVEVVLSDADAARFEAMTRAAIGKQIAIAVGDRVMSRPVVREAIPGGRLHITLGHDGDPRRDARALAARMTTPPLPAAITPVRVGTARHAQRGESHTIALDAPTLDADTFQYTTAPAWGPVACRLFNAPGCRITLGRQAID